MSDDDNNLNFDRSLIEQFALLEEPDSSFTPAEIGLPTKPSKANLEIRKLSLR